jgi:hypothetical protein
VPSPEAQSRARDRSSYERRRRGSERQLEKLRAAQEVGRLTDRELLLVGAVAYWAEGSKSKPWRREERLQFTNSDPRMITLFLNWLELLGVGRDLIRCTVHIHGSADIDRAVQFWSDTVQVPVTEFGKTVIKRHAPRTNRKNTGDGYVGCLTIYVRRSSALYRRTEGLWVGLVDASAPDRRGSASSRGSAIRSGLPSLDDNWWTRFRRSLRSRVV